MGRQDLLRRFNQARALLFATLFLIPPLIACDSLSDPNAAAAPAAARIVSLDPCATSAAIRLGLADRLVALGSPGAQTEPPGLDERCTFIDDALDLPQIESIPQVALYSPNMVLTGPLAPGRRAHLESSLPDTVLLIEVAPHDFPEALLVYREIASAADAVEAFRNVDREYGLPRKQLPGALDPRRPLFAPLESLSPLKIHRGHSFASSIIELAGGESISHDRDDESRAVTIDELSRGGVQGVLYFASPDLPRSVTREKELTQAFSQRGIGLLIINADIDRLWLSSPAAVAKEVAAFVEAQHPAATTDAKPPSNRPARELLPKPTT